MWSSLFQICEKRRHACVAILVLQPDLNQEKCKRKLCSFNTTDKKFKQKVWLIYYSCGITNVLCGWFKNNKLTEVCRRIKLWLPKFGFDLCKIFCIMAKKTKLVFHIYHNLYIKGFLNDLLTDWQTTHSLNC